MPTITKIKKHKSVKNPDNQTIYRLVYNTSQWRKLRDAKLQQNPLCELCLENDKVTPAEDVHHIYEISNGKNEFEMISLGFDFNNLQSLCHDCHQKLHAKKHKKVK